MSNPKGYTATHDVLSALDQAVLVRRTADQIQSVSQRFLETMRLHGGHVTRAELEDAQQLLEEVQRVVRQAEFLCGRVDYWLTRAVRTQDEEAREVGYGVALFFRGVMDAYEDFLRDVYRRDDA